MLGVEEKKTMNSSKRNRSISGCWIEVSLQGIVICCLILLVLTGLKLRVMHGAQARNVRNEKSILRVNDLGGCGDLFMQLLQTLLQYTNKFAVEVVADMTYVLRI